VIQQGLFDSPPSSFSTSLEEEKQAQAPKTRAELQADLDALPYVPPLRRVQGERTTATACVDPIGHLTDCRDPACLDCDLLREQFARCPCGRWAAKAVLYDGRCSGCRLAAGLPLDPNRDTYAWRPPAGLSRSAMSEKMRNLRVARAGKRSPLC
jgi:hypothetical protein